MNSALKPVLTSSGPQNTPVTTQLNKPMHPQGVPTSYGQPPNHMPQSLVNLPHNTNVAHSHPNASQNHFSLNVPNASHNFMGTNSSNIPISNHPVPNPAQGGGQMFNQPKTGTFSSGYQPNLGHPPNQNALPPVSQTLPATTQPSLPPQQTPPPASSEASTVVTPSATDKPQSNGTAEVKSNADSEANHISPAKDKPPTPAPAVVPPQIPPPVEKSPEKAPVQTHEPKPASEPSSKASEEPSVPTPVSSSTSNAAESNVSSTVASTTPSAPVHSPKVPEESSESSQPTENNKNSTPVASTTPPAENAAASSEPSVPEADSSESASSESTEKAAPKTAEENEKPETENAATTPKPAEPSTQKAPSPAKQQTVSPRTPARKSKTPKPDNESPKSSKVESKTTPLVKSVTGKVKRQRIRTQPYQSPLPELEIISKISSSTPRSKNLDEKLIVFYKNEFLAVRNSEGSFYVCQAVQNVYKSSSKIKIRWLSQDKNEKSGEIYTPDFYDLTDFDCILTNLNLSRVDKGKFRLSQAEKERTESILNRSLAVEKGEVTSPSLTEEHPDGLDLSLYKEESQLQKGKKGTKRKANSALKSSKKAAADKKSPDQAKVRKTVVNPVKTTQKKTVVATKKTVVERKQTVNRTDRAKRRNDNIKGSPVVDQKKAKVLAKIGRKTAIPASKAPVPPSTPTTSKSSKVTKPPTKPVPPKTANSSKAAAAPSSSKGTRSAPTTSKAPPVVAATRKTKRSSRK